MDNLWSTDLTKQHFGSSEALQVVRHKNMFWALKIKYYGQVFVWGARRKCVLPEGLAKELPQIVKNIRCLHLIDCTMVLFIPGTNSLQKTPQMHLNTSPTCFEGPRALKIRFRDPGPKNRVQVLLSLVHHQYIHES